MEFIHKKTGHKLLMKNKGSFVSVLFVLDNNGNKVKDKSVHGKEWLNVNGDTIYKIAVCQTTNLIPCNKK